MISAPPTMICSHSMHVQGVHAQVERCQVHALKHLHERLTFPSLHMNYLLGIFLHGPFDEAQQVLLVHAGRSVNVCVHLIQTNEAKKVEQVTEKSTR